MSTEDSSSAAARPRRVPLFPARIVAAALGVVESEGFDALTMRRVAAALEATPGALYVHVHDKAELDDLMLGELCSRVVLPTPDPVRWQEQVIDVCRQLRDQYLRYPGISRATVAAAPHSLEAMRLSEGLLAILTAAGIPVQEAAWATDAAFLYVGAYSLVAPRRQLGGPESAAMAQWFAGLPSDRFPLTTAHVTDIVSGAGHDRFDFTLELLFGGLAPRRT